ncbi:hypothetical protein L9Z73_09735 [Pseudomonas sp. TNT11]|uniref:Lipoprotein n=1 Tax=Pseudomonas emilianonis TaxID=2915812 RepID=A0ABT0EFX0_9PSED|nr:hypothetical protein [Pseudomonas emilianonis]MCK1784623.1 hypothetical protein [Pseudomonas emilianonis]
MKTSRFLLVAGLAILAGCSTPDMLRTKPPSIEISSSNKAKAVAGCIVLDTEEIFREPLARNAKIHTRPISGGYSIWLVQGVAFGESTAMVIDVSDTQSGSTTSFHNDLTSAYLERTNKVIRNCQGT